MNLAVRLTQAQWLQAVALAARAPSPHNAQPARWQLDGDEVRLLARQRRLARCRRPDGP